MRSILFAVLIILIVPSVVRAEELSGKPQTVDGDTIKIDGQRIRLHGIDAPERNQPCTLAEVRFDCGQLSTDALRRIINLRTVRCVTSKRDRYKRWIGKCFVGTLDLQSELTRQGWAFAYRKYSTDYASAEVAARGAKLGLWQYELMKPWDFRKTSEFRKRFKR